jgi:hypothetical protein
MALFLCHLRTPALWLWACAHVMRTCVVGFGPVRIAQPNVRGVAGSKPSRRKTVTLLPPRIWASAQ